eukprot:GHVT01081111.1.p1 GENE.GHVT01081111.1~~GHVT01081111.1.p1  ORF type:complete len:564 (-),score=125.96 GHVT01081111.1:3046-4737(-)
MRAGLRPPRPCGVFFPPSFPRAGGPLRRKNGIAKRPPRAAAAAEDGGEGRGEGGRVEVEAAVGGEAVAVGEVEVAEKKVGGGVEGVKLGGVGRRVEVERGVKGGVGRGVEVGRGGELTFGGVGFSCSPFFSFVCSSIPIPSSASLSSSSSLSNLAFTCRKSSTSFCFSQNECFSSTAFPSLFGGLSSCISLEASSSNSSRLFFFPSSFPPLWRPPSPSASPAFSFSSLAAPRPAALPSFGFAVYAAEAGRSSPPYQQPHPFYQPIHHTIHLPPQHHLPHPFPHPFPPSFPTFSASFPSSFPPSFPPSFPASFPGPHPLHLFRQQRGKSTVHQVYFMKKPDWRRKRSHIGLKVLPSEFVHPGSLIAKQRKVLSFCTDPTRKRNFKFYPGENVAVQPKSTSLISTTFGRVKINHDQQRDCFVCNVLPERREELTRDALWRYSSEHVWSMEENRSICYLRRKSASYAVGRRLLFPPSRPAQQQKRRFKWDVWENPTMPRTPQLDEANRRLPHYARTTLSKWHPRRLERNKFDFDSFAAIADKWNRERRTLREQIVQRESGLDTPKN